jgi:hypothetical protein
LVVLARLVLIGLVLIRLATGIFAVARSLIFLAAGLLAALALLLTGLLAHLLLILLAGTLLS